MSEEQEEVDKSGKVLKKQGVKTRDEKGHLLPGFNPEYEALGTPAVKSSSKQSPKTADYSKMNAILAKNLGLQDKFTDLVEEYTPEQLFRQLSFMNDNTNKKGGLPENQPIAPISPQPNKHELPGKQLKKPNLSKDGFSVSFQIDPKDLLRPKKNKT